MAHQTSVAEWLVGKRQTFDLKILELRWGKTLATPIHDFEASITWNGKVFAGRGTDTEEGVALEKACAETVERLVCSHHSLSTDGVAVHTEQNQARQNARLEALERFLFSWHRENLVPFRKNSNDAEIKIQEWILDLDSEYKIEFRVMNAPTGYVAPVCILSGKNNLFLGLSCGPDTFATYQKASFEALRNMAAQKSNPDRYAAAVKSNPDLWCGDRKFIEQLLPLFTKPAQASSSPLFQILSNSLSTRTVSELDGCPIYVEHASAEKET